MEIREATTDDALGIAKVHVDSWRAAYRGIMPDSLLDSLEYDRRKKYFFQAIENGSDEIFIAELDGQIIGFMTIGPCRDTDVDKKRIGEIWGIYLLPGHWRKGIGSLFCRHAENILFSRRYSEVTLWVLSKNVESRHFYEKMGFNLDGGLKTHNFGTPLEIVRYRKKIWGAEPFAVVDSQDGTRVTV
jgi:ribosomal protein S18 acetylase RimI-like enzyme